jgi:hypothetical protein
MLTAKLSRVISRKSVSFFTKKLVTATLKNKNPKREFHSKQHKLWITKIIKKIVIF